jgi:hypothetical protein
MLNRRTLLTLLAGTAVTLPGLALAGPPKTPPGQGGTPPGQAGNQGGGKGNKNNKNGQSLIADKIKQNGNHKLDAVGKVDVSADVRGGKIVGFHAKHQDKGELTVGKVKSTQRFALLDRPLLPGQAPVDAASVVTVWYYAYWFTDDFGNYWYYWFPVEYIIDDGSWIIYSA